MSLAAEEGTVTGLIGPNGAGKTTLFNVITGLLPPNNGRVRLDGADLTKLSPTKRARRGLGRTFQRLELFSLLSVRENIRVAADVRRGWSRDKDDPATVVEGIIERIGLTSVADARVDSLPTGQCRLVELGRCLATKPQVLLLDEPASGQDETETLEFATLLRALAAEGTTVVLVEHDVQLVMNVCSRVHVLDFGRIIASGTPSEIQTGSGGALGVPRWRPMNLLELRGIRAAYDRIDVLFGIDLEVPVGTVVALLGPNGAGKTTTLRVAAGLHPPTAGDVLIAGRRVNGTAPEELARRGLCLVPEGQGIFPNLTVRENLRMMTYAGVSLRAVEEEAFTRFPRLKERRRQLAGTLSGGEQQMLAMARGLATRPALLLLDELSMGLAPIIVEELYGIVAQIAREGVSILVVEQFASTVLGVADLAAVLVHGKIARVGTPRELESELSTAYLGGESRGSTTEEHMIEHPERVDQFKQDIAAMQVRDPAAARDRLALRGGSALMVIGIVGRDRRVPAVARDRQPARSAGRHHRRRDRLVSHHHRCCAVPARLDDIVPAVLARPPHLRAEGPDRPHRRRRRGAHGPGMTPPAADDLRSRLCALGTAIRDEVIAQRTTRATADLAEVVGAVTADVIYEIDRIGETRVLEWFGTEWPASEPVRLVMEGIEDGRLVTFPDGADPTTVRWVCIVDPIDGSRNLMFDKRSGWVLAAIAPATLDDTGAPVARLPEVIAAAMTEIPTTRAWQADQYSATAEGGPHGIVATAEDLRAGTRSVMPLRPSAATTFEHGFSSFSHSLPDGKAWLARIEQSVWDHLVPPGDGPRQIFEDQYLCSAGQLAEVLCGRDRMVGDLRPFALAALGQPVTLTCHPYDICIAMILQEAGGIVEDPFGEPVDVPLDTTTPVSFVAYTNAELADRMRPVLSEVLQRAISAT